MVHCLSRKLSCPKRRRKILSLGKENGCPRDEMGWTGPFWLGRPCGTSWACRRALSQARHPDPPGTETNPLEGDTHEETIGKQAAVLACLSRYQEQRTLEKADGQEEDAGRFTMVLDVNGETKQLVLGEECYSYGADGWKYRIQNGNRLQQDLGKLLNLPISA